MDPSDARALEVFFDVHDQLPRQGPGDRSCTERALSLAVGLPAAPRVLDIACGPGMQTLDLADLLPAATIEAIDLHPRFVDETRRRIEDRGLDDRARVLRADMQSLPFEDGRFDLIWCEGAAYIMGAGKALRSWRALLKPRGILGFSEAVWLRPDPPEELRSWWHEGYPAMGDAAACRALVENHGYRLLGDFVLPESAWWSHYYTPLEKRLRQLESKYTGDPVAMGVVHESQEEIDTFRRYAEFYGYLFLVAARDHSCTR